MSQNKKLFSLLLILLLLDLAAVVYFKKIKPSQQEPPPGSGASLEFSYQVSGCQEKREKEYSKIRGEMEKVDLKLEQGFLNLTHSLNYLCCAKMTAVLDSAENLGDYTLIRIKEKNEGAVCRCMCDYQVSGRVGPLKEGKYLIQILGVEFKDIPADPLWEKEIVIDEKGNLAPAAEEFCGFSTKSGCQNDSDCKKSGCSGQICQSISEESKISTCEWRDCYNAENYGLECKCVENQCQWEKF